MLQWLHEHGFEWYSERAIHCAARAGQLEVLKWLEATCSDQCKYKLPGLEAALNGHFAVVRWMVEDCKSFDAAERSKWLFQAMDAAIETGNWPMLRYLFRHRQQKCATDGINKAIVRGDLEMVKWLHGKGFTCSREVDPMEDAAKHGHLEILRWLYQNLPEESTSEEVMNIAAARNHLHIVQWLHTHRTEGCNETAMVFAANNGHLDMVHWLYANRPEYGANDTNAMTLNCQDAAEQLSLENGFLVTSAMDFAAASGHLEIVKVLHEHQESCSVRAMDLAAAYRNLRVVQWLHTNRPEGCSTNAMDLAAANGHLEVVQWLHANRLEGCTESAVDDAAANGHLPVVCWLLDNRSEGFTDDGLNEAAANGHCEILATLVAACPDFECTFLCAQRAVNEGQFEILEWMEQFGSGHLNRHIPSMLQERAAQLLSA